MIDTKVFLKMPLSFENICLVYPPSISDVFSSSHFNNFYQLLCISQEEIEDIFVKTKPDIISFPTPLEFLLNNCYNNKQIEQIALEGFNFFIKEPVSFLYQIKSILIGDIKKEILELKNTKEISTLKLINEDNYFDFQNLLRKSLGAELVEKPNPNEHPKIKAMKAKARYRDKIKIKQNQGSSFQSFLEAICCMGMGLNPLNIGGISYASVNSLVSRYQLKEKYDLDINSILAGANSKSKKVHPIYWISGKK